MTAPAAPCVHDDEPAGHPPITLPAVADLPAEAWCYSHRRWETTEGDRLMTATPGPVILFAGLRFDTIDDLLDELDGAPRFRPTAAFTDRDGDDWHHTGATLNGEPLYLCYAGDMTVLTRAEVETAYGVAVEGDPR